MILQNLAKLHNMLEVSLFVRSESLYTCLGWQKSDLWRVDYDSRESVGIQVDSDIHPQEHFTIT